MLSHLPTKLLISGAFAAAMVATLNAAALSTVSPYIQQSQASIDAQVNAGMNNAAARISAIRANAEKDLQTGYEKKEVNLKSIRELQAQSLLLLRQIDHAQTRCADLRAAGTRLDAAAAQATLGIMEKTAVSAVTESQ